MALAAPLYLLASVWHQGVHMVWKQTRVPSLSKMTRPGLKVMGFSLATLEEGEEEEGLASVERRAQEGEELDEEDSRAAKDTHTYT